MSKINIASDAMNTGGNVTVEMDDDDVQVLREHFLIEMLQGQREPMADGRTRYTFEVGDPEKLRALWNAVASMPKAVITSHN